ncbi:hypothetical protein BDW62DRAFT_206306 [Aspergillus aurantiobrunneus]
MAKKDKACIQARQAVRQEIRTLYIKKQPIDREAIKAKHIAKHPELAQRIRAMVDDYSAHLEKQRKAVEKSSIAPNARNAAPQPPPAVTNSSDSSKVTSDELIDGESVDTEISETSEDELDCSDGVEILDNALLQDFKEHLSKRHDEERPAATISILPPLEDQKQFLTSDEDDETPAATSRSMEHASLVSTALENMGYGMPSQFALLGKLKPVSKTASVNPDPRVVLNTNVPFSAFICGLQGSGKSHTTACIIENCSMAMPKLGNIRQAVSTLVLHFNEYSSNVNSQPSEAAFLAAVLPQYVSQQKPPPLRVLVSPTNFRNLAKMYAHIPNVEVRPFRIQPRHLNIGMMLSLMSMSQGKGMPLYMEQVLRLLREMAMESGGQFNYSLFRKRLDKLKLDRSQTPFLAQRLELLDSYLDLKGKATDDYFVEGGVTILDLSCPFVDQTTACILFRIAIDIFLYAHPSRGKMVVADEAHKYMTDTSAAKELTETFLTIIRQQRHLGVRTVISTQEPTISPRLIDLCSITIIHRFTSPQWYGTIRTHLPIERGQDTNDPGISDGLYHIANLRTGEAIAFAPSAQLVDEHGTALDTKHHTFRLMVRKRITWDGGRTILSVR